MKRKYRSLSDAVQLIPGQFREIEPTVLAALVKSIVGYLPGNGELARQFERAARSVASGRLLQVIDAQGETLGGLVIEIQLRRREDDRADWPVFAWEGRFALGGKPTTVVVIAPHDSVARWAQKIIVNGGNTFQADVLGRHNLPVITDLKQARENPLLALLSAFVHLQSRRPPRGSSQSQEDKTRQDAEQLRIAEKIANAYFADVEDYKKMLSRALARSRRSAGACE